MRFPWQRELNLRLIKYDKRREKKKKRRKIGLYILLILILLIAAGVFIVMNVFTVENVVVEGNELYSSTQIEKHGAE